MQKHFALVVALALTFGVAACTSSSPPPPAAVPATVGSTPPTTTGAPSSASTSTRPPITVGGDQDVNAVLDVLAPIFRVTDSEKACMYAKLSADTELLGRVKTSVSPGSDDFNAIAVMMNQCKQATFGDIFAKDFASSTPLTPEQTQCLSESYANLSQEDLTAISSSAVFPSGTDAPRGKELMNKLLDGCAVPHAG